ncbi:MAG TPA: type II toxin-antitoxin system VapC family toxin [Candidatus Deferrimicrobiaceae bacterium]|nr:type II toxin-antitoxin system VapC family toxin [Candidatus Deferrimicrobiaceae bacterium]
MENPRVIIDTDILVDFLRNKHQATLFIRHLEEKNCLLSTTTINAFELYYGAHKSPNPEKTLYPTTQLLNRLFLMPLTPKSAQKAGHIYAVLEKQGQPIGLRDTLIGAIALTRNCSVATRNTEHFQKITDLKLIH